jgi:hypothetical protein
MKKLTTTYKEAKPFRPNMPWRVRIAPDEKRGIKGGIMGPFRTRREALAWAEKFNNANE